MAEIAAVLFDADGVVQHQGNYLAQLAESQRWSDEELVGFMDAVFAVERPLLAQEADFIPLLESVANTHGLSMRVDEFLEDWCRLGIVVDASALELVRGLRARGVICGLATNQVSYRADYMLKHLGYRDVFDHLFVSCRMGWAKPSPAFFESALAILGLPREQVLFIDDHLGNVDAARSVGLRAAQLAPGGDLASVLAEVGLSFRAAVGM